MIPSSIFNVGSGFLRQTLQTVYVAGTEYSFSIDVSPRVDDSLLDDLALVFYAGSGQSNEVARELYSFVQTDTLETITLTASAAEIAAAGAVDQQVRIAIENNNDGIGVANTDFDLDNIRVTTTAPQANLSLTD